MLKTPQCALRHIRVSDTNTDKTEREGGRGRKRETTKQQSVSVKTGHTETIEDIMRQIKTDDAEVREQAVISAALFMSLFIIKINTPIGKHIHIFTLYLPVLCISNTFESLHEFPECLNMVRLIWYHSITHFEAESYHNTIQ